MNNNFDDRPYNMHSQQDRMAMPGNFYGSTGYQVPFNMFNNQNQKSGQNQRGSRNSKNGQGNQNRNNMRNMNGNMNGGNPRWSNNTMSSNGPYDPYSQLTQEGNTQNNSQHISSGSSLNFTQENVGSQLSQDTAGAYYDGSYTGDEKSNEISLNFGNEGRVELSQNSFTYHDLPNGHGMGMGNQGGNHGNHGLGNMKNRGNNNGPGGMHNGGTNNGNRNSNKNGNYGNNRGRNVGTQPTTNNIMFSQDSNYQAFKGVFGLLNGLPRLMGPQHGTCAHPSDLNLLSPSAMTIFHKIRSRKAKA